MQFHIIACGAHDVIVNALPFSQPDAQFTLLAPPAFPLSLVAGAQHQ